MSSTRIHQLALVLALLVVDSVHAAPPSYRQQVYPFLARYCLECHSGEDPSGGLNLASYQSLRAGGAHGPVLIPGKAQQSRIVRMVDGTARPKMPPRKARQPAPAEVALLRTWIDAGALDDTSRSVVTTPDIRPRAPVPPPVTALAYHPAGTLLAAAAGREVFLFDAIGGLQERLQGLSGKVTALAFGHEGSALAVATSAPGGPHEVRLYAFDGVRLGQGRMLGTTKDTVYALAFSPDGKLLAAAGYDRLIRLWDAGSAARATPRLLKDHSDAVHGLAFSPDGKFLASAAADRAVKVWDVAAGRRLYTLGEPTDWVYAVAFSPDGQHLAAAGVDRSIRVWQITPGGASITHSIFAHEGPVTRLVYSTDGKTLYSLSEDRKVKAWDTVRMTERTVYATQPDTPLALAVGPDGKQLALGRFDGALLLLDEATGKTQSQLLPLRPEMVDPFPLVHENEPNDSPRTAQTIPLPASIIGSASRAGDVDWYRFDAGAGQEIGVQVLTAAVGSRLEPVLQLVDPKNQIVAGSANGLLGYMAQQSGTYALGIHDRDYRGGTGMHYRLHIGPIPIITGVFPLGLPRGCTSQVQLEGVHRGPSRSVQVTVSADASPGSRLPVPASSALGNPSVVVGEFPEVVEGGTSVIPVPGTANGRIHSPGASQTWRFQARQGQRLLLEVNARRLGSPLDSVLEILDHDGRPLPLAMLRCVSRTYVAFRDHDSVTPNIRLETWGDLAVNDYVLLGQELLRIRALPRNPDDDCQFFSEQGQRLGYLGTTPAYHPMGEPLYRVSLHPPGTTFPPNGLPLLNLYHRNDDGGPGFGKDSRLTFDPPADGEYQVRLSDARGAGGPLFAYRLTIRPPRPDFTVRFSAPAVWRGGAVPVEVTAQRIDGFEDAIELRLENLPLGLDAPSTFIPAGENSTAFALYAGPSAVLPAKPSPLKLIAKGQIDGRSVVHEVPGSIPQLADGADIATTTEQSEVMLRPGGKATVSVRVDRLNGFKGRIPLEVRGLPHGVRVLDIGLNGILITEQETRRTFVLHAEPWVRSMQHPFVVLARQEGKGTEYAARSILLRISPP